MYKELLLRCAKDIPYVKPQAPCSEQEIRDAEKAVGVSFPSELSALLSEMNGDGWLVLSAKEIGERAVLNRQGFFDCFDSEEEYEEKVGRFLFFATNGYGDDYGYRITKDKKADTSAIVLWEHEEFTHRVVAKDISDLIERYFRNEI